MKTIFERNRLLFLWKNITDPLLLYLILLWFPANLLADILTLRRKRLTALSWAIPMIPAVLERRRAGRKRRISDRKLLAL